MTNGLNKLFISLLFSPCLLLSTFCIGADHITTLKITGNGQNGVINSAYLNSARNFEKLNPNVKIKVQLQSDKAYKRNLPFILSDKSPFDIVIMHAGEPLQQAITERKVLPITSLWNKNNFDENFSKPMKHAVSQNDKVYAIPLSYYLWGFYYKKSFFDSLNVTPPSNWKEFITLLSIMKLQNVTPIYLGTKNPWPIGAWFEYLNLRINGIEFHYQFIDGFIDSNSKEIHAVLSHLKELIDANYFNNNHHTKTLSWGLPLLLRDQASMLLAGGSFEKFLPPRFHNDIGFFSFPRIIADAPTIQVSPIDVMTISNSSKHPDVAKRFLKYMANAEVQAIHNEAINQLPANLHSTIPKLGTSSTSINYLRNADGLTLFYDREVEKEYGLQNLTIWKAFLDNSNIELTQQEMEKARQSYINRKNKTEKIKP